MNLIDSTRARIKVDPPDKFSCRYIFLLDWFHQNKACKLILFNLIAEKLLLYYSINNKIKISKCQEIFYKKNFFVT